MRRSVISGLAAVGLVLAGFALAQAQNAFGSREKQMVAKIVASPQPDTTAPQWKPLSDDLGVWISESEQFGLEGRLFVRVEGQWVPVAVDGTRELHGIMPAR